MSLHKRLTWMTLVLAALLGISGTAAAAPDVMQHPDVAITVDIPKFGLVVPNTPSWSFTLTSTDTNPDDGITFTASGFSYSLRVFSNTNVTVTLDDGRIDVGGTWFYPLYEWGADTYWARASDPWTLYVSGGPVANHTLPLTGFGIHVGAPADPNDPTSPTNPGITQFVPGNATGTLVVTIQATP